MSAPEIAIDRRGSASADAAAKWVARITAPAIVVVGCGALASRSSLAAATSRPTAVLVLLFCGLLGAGAWLPVPRGTWSSSMRVDARVHATVALLGIVAFAAGRVLVGGRAPVALSTYAVVTSSLAAIAEEAFFRRLCFGLLRPAGPTFAIVGSSALFAIVHVATYGWWVLPLDMAAGLLLGWQRAATGLYGPPWSRT